jgi:UDP-glucose 4-epimerase
VVFSSSASVYADAPSLTVYEHSPTDPRSPYARTKRMMEMVLQDMAAATGLRALILRYFNPIGADPGLRHGIHVRKPSDVMSQLVLAAQGRRDTFAITGTDYPTRDGTGLRDYIHVWDLALAHVCAVERFDETLGAVGESSIPINLGTGVGVTVRELVDVVKDVLGQPVPIREAPRRPGDVTGACANVDRARNLLGWTARSSLRDGVESAIGWMAKRAEVLGYD